MRGVKKEFEGIADAMYREAKYRTLVDYFRFFPDANHHLHDQQRVLKRISDLSEQWRSQNLLEERAPWKILEEKALQTDFKGFFDKFSKNSLTSEKLSQCDLPAVWNYFNPIENLHALPDRGPASTILFFGPRYCQ